MSKKKQSKRQKRPVILLSSIEPTRNDKRASSQASPKPMASKKTARKFIRGSYKGSLLYVLVATVTIVACVGVTVAVQVHSSRSGGKTGLPEGFGITTTLFDLFNEPKKVSHKATNTQKTKTNTTPPPPPLNESVINQLPAALRELSTAECGKASVMNIVAHEDDDLLFINPDTLQSVRAGACVRTIYVTAGDDGRGEAYWSARQRGAQAAYSAMLGRSVVWSEQRVELGSNQYVTISTPEDDHRISLLFMNLPDGNLDGEGYVMWDRESLAKLWANQIAAIYSVDSSSHYTPDQLVSAFVTLMQVYQPTEVRTQADEVVPGVGDHSDHAATGFFASRAVALYSQKYSKSVVAPRLHYYVGYSMRSYNANLTPGEASTKAAIFFSYAQYDPNACSSFRLCSGTSYGEYFQRQYRR